MHCGCRAQGGAAAHLPRCSSAHARLTGARAVQWSGAAGALQVAGGARRGRAAGAQVPEQHAKAPDVGALGHGGRWQQLRRHPLGARHARRLRARARCETLDVRAWVSS